MCMAQEHSIRVIIGSFAWLSGFNDSVLATGEDKSIGKLGGRWVVCQSVDEGLAVRGDGVVICRRWGRD